MAARRAMAALLLALLAHVRALEMAETVAMASSAGSTNGSSSSNLCDSQLLFQKLYVLMPAINQCAMESDYFIKPSNLSIPSDESLKKYCSSKNCTQLSQELDNAGLPSCSVPVGNTTMSFKVFFKNIKDRCDASTPSSSNGPGASTSPAVRIRAGVVQVVVATVLVAIVAAISS